MGYNEWKIIKIQIQVITSLTAIHSENERTIIVAPAPLNLISNILPVRVANEVPIHYGRFELKRS